MSMRELLPILPRPSRYAGIEEGAVRKNPGNIKLRAVFAFPDTYEVGMSYLGQKILYNIVNSRSDWWGERVFLPEKEAADILRESGVELASLESDTSLRNFAAVGFSVTHELCYTDILHMLDLAHIPLRSDNRGDDLETFPIIMAGGGAIIGVEALSPFIDLIALGDGEEQIIEIFELLQHAREKGWSRKHFLKEASGIAGVYIPSLYPVNESGIVEIPPDMPRPARRVVADLETACFPEKQPLPIGAIHDRLVIEISRGCTRGCRFCQAGFVYRPVRERSAEKIREILESSLESTGFDEVSFLSLSAGDHSELSRIFNESFSRCAKEQVSMALPSLRVGSVGANILERMAKIRRTGITLAPEAGSQRLRDVINKGIGEKELIDHILLLLSLGWKHVKLYFMLGLPTESDADLEEIVNLCDRTRDAARAKGKNIQITASLSTFVPKPFTPFQWEKQPSLEEIQRRIDYILAYAKNRKYLKIRWHDPRVSHLEGILSRADRRMANVVERAYKKGATYTGWTEHFRLEPWEEALKECGISPEEMKDARALGQTLPWSHQDCGVTENYLMKERQKAYEQLITEDCRNGVCGLCGVCDKGGRKSHLARPQNFKGSYLPVIAKNKNGTVRDTPIPLAQNSSVPSKDTDLFFKAQSYRVWHVKKGNYAFLSQIELQDMLEKTQRRAKIPLAFSAGFHPLPLVSFTRALSVGIESEAEWFSLILREKWSPEELTEKLNDKLPKEMRVFETDLCDMRQRTVQAHKEQFEIQFAEETILNHAADRLEKICASEEWNYIYENRKGRKSVNLRPFIYKWQPKGKLCLNLYADWTEAYLSPLLLLKGILGENFTSDKFPIPFRICKKSQFLGNALRGIKLFEN